MNASADEHLLWVPKFEVDEDPIIPDCGQTVPEQMIQELVEVRQYEVHGCGQEKENEQLSH
jgi:hypothetical protein